jgi:hypothetical protein
VSNKPAESKIQRYRVSCISVSPFLQNPMTDEILDELLGAKGARKKIVTDISVEDRAKKKLCRGPNSEYGFPETYLFSCLINAGRYVVFEGKKKISTLGESLLPSFFSIVPDVRNESGDGFIPFTDQTAGWVPDKRRGVLAANKAAVAIVRPKFPTWGFEVTIEVDSEQINIDKVQDLFNVAGRQCGLGDFRPLKRGPFGRFKVLDFVEVAAEEIKQAA